MGRPLVYILFISICFVSESINADSLSIDDFLAPPTLLNAQLSPSGKLVATVWNHGYRRDVRIFDLSDNKLVSNFGDHINRPYAISWAGESRLLVKVELARNSADLRKKWDEDGPFIVPVNERRLFATDIDGENKVKLLNDDRVAQHAFNLATISNHLINDKDHILTVSWRRQFLTQFKVNIKTGQSEIVAKGSRFTIGFINDKDGNLLYRYDYKPVARRVEVFSFEGEENWILKEKIYFDEENESKNKISIKDLVGVYQDSLVYRKRNEKTGFYELILRSDEDTQSKPLVSLPDRDVLGVITSAWNDEIVGYRTLIDHYRSHYFSQSKQAYYEKVAQHFPEESFYFTSFSEGADKALIKAWGQHNPGSYFLFDKKDSRLTLFSYPYHKIPAQKLGYGIATSYLARDKKSIRAYVLFPPGYDGNEALPTVILPHGGPHARDAADYDDFAQFLTTRGYIVIKPNFRGSTGYGKAFEEAGYKQWGGTMQDDLEDAAKFLITEGLAVPDRICFVGISYGGYAALMATVKTPNLVKCSVSINGVSHLPEQIEFDLDKFSDQETQAFVLKSIGDPDNDMPMLQRNSPALHAEKIVVPVLLIASENDNVVPIEQSELMYKALRKNAKTVSFIELEDTGHNPFNNDENTRLVYEEVSEFLSKYLQTNGSKEHE